MKISDNPFFKNNSTYFINPNLSIFMGRKIWPPSPAPTIFKNFKKFIELYKGWGGGGGQGRFQLCFSFFKLTFTDWKITATLSLKEADNIGCLRFDAFDFQLKFDFKYTNFVLKENYFFVMICTL